MNEKLWFWYLWKSSTQNHGGCIYASGVLIVFDSKYVSTSYMYVYFNFVYLRIVYKEKIVIMIT